MAEATPRFMNRSCGAASAASSSHDISAGDLSFGSAISGWKRVSGAVTSRPSRRT